MKSRPSTIGVESPIDQAACLLLIIPAIVFVTSIGDAYGWSEFILALIGCAFGIRWLYSVIYSRILERHQKDSLTKEGFSDIRSDGRTFSAADAEGLHSRFFLVKDRYHGSYKSKDVSYDVYRLIYDSEEK